MLNADTMKASKVREAPFFSLDVSGEFCFGLHVSPSPQQWNQSSGPSLGRILGGQGGTESALLLPILLPLKPVSGLPWTSCLDFSAAK